MSTLALEVNDSITDWLTFFIAIDLSDGNLAGHVLELCIDFVGSLVPNGRQHIAEPTPVGVEVDKDQLVVFQGRLDVVRVELDGPAVDGVVKQVKQLKREHTISH